MKRRNFFNTAAIGAVTCLRFPRSVGAQSTGDNSRTTCSEAADASKPTTPGEKQIMQAEFKPGDKVPVSGVYDVIHDKVDGSDHTAPHQVTAIAGTNFPRCRVCRGEVRFRLNRPVEHIQAHSDFKQ